MNWERASISVACLVPVIGLLAFGLTRRPEGDRFAAAGQARAGIRARGVRARRRNHSRCQSATRSGWRSTRAVWSC